MKAGHLYGLGLGPGDPELVTLKALRLLRSVAVVAYPAPEEGDSFARAIAAEWLDRGQTEIAIRFPMRPGPPPAAIYDDAAARLAAVLDRGDDIAFLCQGDPLFYGSFAGILTRLAPPYPMTVVPGVSSALAGCPAASTSASAPANPATGINVLRISLPLSWVLSAAAACLFVEPEPRQILVDEVGRPDLKPCEVGAVGDDPVPP